MAYENILALATQLNTARNADLLTYLSVYVPKGISTAALAELAELLTAVANNSAPDFSETELTVAGLTLSDTVWDDLRVSLVATKLGGSKDPTFGKVLDDGEVSPSQGVFAYQFHQSNEQEVYFAAQMPHGMKLGQPITAHVHWMPITNGSAGQKVSWGLEYTWQDIGSTFGNTNIVYSNTHIPADSALVAKRHYLTSFGNLTGAGSDVSSILLCRLFRDAGGVGKTDDYGGLAAGLYMDFHIEIDALGSAEQYTK